MKEKKTVILVVSFGTSYADSIKSSIEAIENNVKKAFPSYEVRRAFTSSKILRKLKKRDGIIIDNVKEALERLLSEGCERVVVQPTYVIKGIEYDLLENDVRAYEDKFSSLSLGEPILCREEDYIYCADAVCEKVKAEGEKTDTAVVFMGHGTDHPENSAYIKLGQTFLDLGLENYFVGTVEAEPDIFDIKRKLEEKGIKNVFLLPFMIVAGDHARNDMAGDDDSWKSILENAGFNVKCFLSGLGENEEIRKIILKKIEKQL